jgi:hypothetical protein
MIVDPSVDTLGCMRDRDTNDDAGARPGRSIRQTRGPGGRAGVTDSGGLESWTWKKTAALFLTLTFGALFAFYLQPEPVVTGYSLASLLTHILGL